MQHTVIYDIATGAIVDMIAGNATLSGLGAGLATMRADCTGTETNISEVTPAPVNPVVAAMAKNIAKQFGKVNVPVPGDIDSAMLVLDGLPETTKANKAAVYAIAAYQRIMHYGGDWSHVLAEVTP